MSDQLDTYHAQWCAANGSQTAPWGMVSLAAKALGVTREHLSRVLHGHRQSRRLTRRYEQFLREQENQTESQP